MKILKWTTVKEFVDVETGEVLTEKLVNEEYIIIKKTKKTQFNERLNRINNELYYEGVVTITNICNRAGKQIKLF